MNKYYEVSRYEDTITILKPITPKEAEELNTVNVLKIDDEKLNKFINLNVDEKTITINKNGEVELGENTYYGISLRDENKVKIAKRARQKLDGIVHTSDLVYYIEFIETNNILNSRGFFITEDNKEEKYLEILEAGDEDLINTLERFLNSRDKLGKVKSAKTEFDNIIESLKYADENNKEELEQIERKIT